MALDLEVVVDRKKQRSRTQIVSLVVLVEVVKLLLSVLRKVVAIELGDKQDA